MEKDADTANAQALQHSAQSSGTDAQSFEHKVIGLRLHLRHRKRAYQSHKTWVRFTRFFVVILMLAAGAVGYYYRAALLPRDKPVSPIPPATLEPPTASVASETASEITLQRRPDSPLIEVDTAPAQVFSAPAIPDAPASPSEVPAAASTPAPESRAAVTPVPETPLAETQKAPPKEPAPPVLVTQQSQPAAPTLSHIRIARSQACTSVQARQCRGAQKNFSLSQHPKPHVWMLVYSKSLPYVLKHVYYHEGRHYAQVPLTIKHKRMRTWSTISLKGLAHVGSWRVDIEAADGTVLDQVEFQVSP